MELNDLPVNVDPGTLMFIIAVTIVLILVVAVFALVFLITRHRKERESKKKIWAAINTQTAEIESIKIKWIRKNNEDISISEQTACIFVDVSDELNYGHAKIEPFIDYMRAKYPVIEQVAKAAYAKAGAQQPQGFNKLFAGYHRSLKRHAVEVGLPESFLNSITPEINRINNKFRNRLRALNVNLSIEAVRLKVMQYASDFAFDTFTLAVSSFNDFEFSTSETDISTLIDSGAFVEALDILERSKPEAINLIIAARAKVHTYQTKKTEAVESPQTMMQLKAHIERDLHRIMNPVFT